MFIVLGMIVLVAAFNVVSSLIMMVKDKTRDIAVLRTIGADSFSVLRIFLMCGAFVGVTGTLIGTVIGIVFCHNIVAVQHAVESVTGGRVFNSSVFMLTALPNTIDWGDVARVVILGLVLSLLATLYPSWRAARTIRWKRYGMSDPLVLRDVRRTYRSEAGELSVLRGADLTLRAGEIVALVAPSGAGKSTLLHLAGLLEMPDGGSVFVEGRDAGTLPDAAPHCNPARHHRLRLSVPSSARRVHRAGECRAAADDCRAIAQGGG